MSEQDYPLLPVAESSKGFTKSSTNSSFTRNVKSKKDKEHRRDSRLGRSTSFQTALRPNFGKIRSRFQKLNCFKSQREEEVPMMEMPRHKSIDIGVGLARKMSLFLFTKKTVCVHPYHPYTPSQTTRKIYIFAEDKH